MVLRVVTYALIALLLVPLGAIVATSFTTLSYVTFPPQGFTLRWYGRPTSSLSGGPAPRSAGRC